MSAKVDVRGTRAGMFVTPHGSPGPRDEHAADEKVGSRDGAGDVVAVGEERNDLPAEHIVEVAKAIEIHVEDRDIGAQADRRLGGIEADRAGPQDDGEMAGDLAHGGEEREAAVGALHGLIGDRDDLGLAQCAGQLRRRRQVKVGEEHLPRPKPGYSSETGSFAFSTSSASAHTWSTETSSAPAFANSSSRIPLAGAGLALDEHAVSLLPERPRPGRRQGDALLSGLDLLGDADDQRRRP